MSELHLLDILAARHGCFISDLNLSPILRRAALLDLCRMDENSYPLSQWRDTVRYLTGDERDFASVKEIKAFIKKKAAEKNISAQLVMQNYMLERLLERIALSKYKNNFILKGGFLISAIVGLDTRATMDLDTTVKGFALTHESIRKIFFSINGSYCHNLLW